MNTRDGKIKASILIADKLAENGCRVVFGVSGGASLHLLEAIVHHPDLSLVTVHHEQSVSMAAEAYSRITGRLGVGIVTSGPGATNLVTGVAGAFYDSVACIFLTGQVSTFRSAKGLGVRQYGFQETPTQEIFKSITKLSLEVQNIEEIAQIIDEAASFATSGRPGPVIIDIPDNLQRENIPIENSQIVKKTPDRSKELGSLTSNCNLETLEFLFGYSRRPVFIAGWGVILSRRENLLLRLFDNWKIPVALTWGAKHLVPADRSYLLGTFGTHGSRSANKVIQNSDLLITFGTRLDTKSTGTPADSFARNAKKVMFDIDENEYSKFKNKGLNIDQFYKIDFRSQQFEHVIASMEAMNTNHISMGTWSQEVASHSSFQEKYPENPKFLNPYNFIENLSSAAPNFCRVIVDTGCSVAWTMQKWKVKFGQRIYHDFNNTAMGWSIPASVASTTTGDEVPTICIVGDGSLMMSVGDLSTLNSQDGPIVIFILNNHGYSMIKQTQEQWFSSNYFASDVNTGLSFPCFETLASAFGFNYESFSVRDSRISEKRLRNLMIKKTIVEVFIDPGARVIPQNRFGHPIDVMEPN